jgi:hypothetical protein
MATITRLVPVTPSDQPNIPRVYSAQNVETQRRTDSNRKAPHQKQPERSASEHMPAGETGQKNLPRRGLRCLHPSASSQMKSANNSGLLGNREWLMCMVRAYMISGRAILRKSARTDSDLLCMVIEVYSNFPSFSRMTKENIQAKVVGQHP